MDARVCTPATSLCSRGPIRVLKGASTFSPSCKKAVKRGIIISGVIVGILVAIKKKGKSSQVFNLLGVLRSGQSYRREPVSRIK